MGYNERMAHPPDTPTAAVPLAPGLFFLAGLLPGLALEFLLPSPHFLSHRLAVPLGWVVTGLGLALALGAMGQMRRAGTPIDPLEPSRVLLTGGLFRLSRNPIYLGDGLVCFGLALVLRSLWAMLLLVPAVALLQRWVIRAEERYLAARFGSAYHAYTTRVRRWL